MRGRGAPQSGMAQIHSVCQSKRQTPLPQNLWLQLILTWSCHYHSGEDQEIQEFILFPAPHRCYFSPPYSSFCSHSTVSPARFTCISTSYLPPHSKHPSLPTLQFFLIESAMMYFRSKKALLSISIKFGLFRRIHKAIAPQEIRANLSTIDCRWLINAALHATPLLVPPFYMWTSIWYNKSQLSAHCLGGVTGQL